MKNELKSDIDVFISERKEEMYERFFKQFHYYDGVYKDKLTYTTEYGDKVSFWVNAPPQRVLDFLETEIAMAIEDYIRIKLKDK